MRNKKNTNKKWQQYKMSTFTTTTITKNWYGLLV